VQEYGGETHVVLPFPVDEFRRASVDVAEGNWGERFERVLARADSVTITSDHRARDSAATFEYANLVFTGMAQLRAQVLQTQLCSLAVWDAHSQPGAGGGASSVVQVWQRRGLEVEHVHLPDLRRRRGVRPRSRGARQPVAAGAAPARGAARGFRHEIRAMLFADMVGYSALSEDQIPTFVAQFLGSVAGLNARTGHRPEHVETSGDGLYMVFAGVAEAAHYALELGALVRAIDWVAHGLPGRTQLRIALHCGPVYCGRNPVTGSPLYTGPHTSRTARIEPITPPGQVYASSAFAAVAAAVGVEGLSMSYVGRMPLPKGYGTLPLYHVRPLVDAATAPREPAGGAAGPA
jgi:class 3 adenylate cyclase